ncbi:hypothetical protein ACFQYP_01575 [Nonomuraea antimicrobica]
MIRSLNKLGDRLLGKLLPSATASADTCRTTPYGHRCRIVGGYTICGP